MVDPAVRRVVDRAVAVFARDLGCSVEYANIIGRHLDDANVLRASAAFEAAAPWADMHPAFAAT
ncbi:MAG: hypothetical protein IT338_14060 [Thermomicrobiales bacterium]|nr:hypothetical protein [Thermomicrobiales bacterium]